MRRAIGLGLAIMLCCAALGGCGSRSDENAQEVFFKTGDEVFQFTASDDWESMEGELNGEACLEIAHAYTEEYIVAIVEDKNTFAMTYDEYNEAVISRMLEAVDDAEIKERTEIEIAGAPGIMTQLQGTVGNEVNRYWIGTLETGDYYIQLIGWTPKSRAEDNDASIKQVLGSFTILP